MYLYVLCPIFNEELNIEQLSKTLINELKEHKTKFVFVDDGSTDKSLKLINFFF